MKSDSPRYIRFILNEDIIAYKSKSAKAKQAVSKAREEQPEVPDPMIEILNLSKTLTK